MKRIKSILVQLVVEELDEEGDVIGEQISQPIQLWKKSTPDIWTKLEDAIKNNEGFGRKQDS